MSDSFLNPVDLKVGAIVVLTDEFHRFARQLFKANPDFKHLGKYEILEIKEGLKRDYITDLDDPTVGVTRLKNLESGIEFDINDESLDVEDDFWSFFTNHTPEYFVLTKRD